MQPEEAIELFKIVKEKYVQKTNRKGAGDSSQNGRREPEDNTSSTPCKLERFG